MMVAIGAALADSVFYREPTGRRVIAQHPPRLLGHARRKESMDAVSNLSPREHVEFVRERDVAWTAFDPLGAPSGRRVKYLTKGTESAAFSGLVRYPTGFEAPCGAHGR